MGIIIHFVLNAATGLLVLLSTCSVLLHGGLMRLKTAGLPLPSSQNPLSCADFQHVINGMVVIDYPQ